MKCTRNEFENKVGKAYPHCSFTMVTVSGTPPETNIYAYPPSNSAIFRFGSNSDHKTMEQSSYFVWKDGEVVKDTLGLFTGMVTYPTVMGGYAINLPTFGQGQSIRIVCDTGESQNLMTSSTKISKCECGAHKVGSNVHSDWCDLRELA